MELQNEKQILREGKKSKQLETLGVLQKDLQLPGIPLVIECFDNSNFQGTTPVASMVRFVNGKADKKNYRHFNIKTVTGSNDFASMKEIVSRRYKRIMEEAGQLPDLIMVHPERSGAPIVFAELKTQKGRVRPEQRAWLDAIQERMGILIGDYVIADVFRPSDLDYLQALLEGRDEWRQTA